jgi:general secretion pathway protein N
MINRLILLMLIAGSLMFAAVVYNELRPGDAKEAEIAKVAARQDSAPTLRRQQGPRVEELVATILARPLFSSTRRPAQDAPAAAAADGDLADTRLTGILTEPGRRMAIFAVNGGKPLKVAEGDEVSGWRVESITPREISLSGPGGTKTLQPKLDPNLAGQVPQPPVANPAAPLPTPGGRPATAAARGRLPAPPLAAGRQPNTAEPISAPGVPRPARPSRLRQQP